MFIYHTILKGFLKNFQTKIKLSISRFSQKSALLSSFLFREARFGWSSKCAA